MHFVHDQTYIRITGKYKRCNNIYGLNVQKNLKLIKSINSQPEIKIYSGNQSQTKN